MRKAVLKVVWSACCVFALPVLGYAQVPNEMQRMQNIKQIRLQGIENRLNVLQQERACVMSVMTMEALQSCEQSSQQMMEKMREQQKASWESLKASQSPEKENK